jgi:4-amino-4-deoxy-L-arabinose transferase-like glycosyltransferase
MFKSVSELIYKRRISSTLIITLVLVASFLLRIYKLGSHDLWYDEVFSEFFSRAPLDNWNAPLYLSLLHFWVKVFGVSEFSLRFPSVLFSFSTTMIVYLIGKELFNRKTAILATLLISLSSFHLWYAQEARDYSMVLFFGTLSSYFLILANKKSSFKPWLLFTLISLCGIYTNYFYIFLITSQFLYVLYITRSLNNKVFLAFVFILGLSSFYAPRFISKFIEVSKGFWIFKPDLQSLSITFQNYMLGYSGTFFLYTLSSVLILGFFIMLFMIMRKRKEVIRSVSFCVFLLFFPIGLAFLFSCLFFSVYLNRALLLFSPYFYLLISCLVMELPKKASVAMASVLILIFSCGAALYFHDYMYPPLEYHMGAYLKKPVKPVISCLRSNYIDRDDIIAFTNESVMPGINFYSNQGFCMYYLFSPQVLVLDPSWHRPVKESVNSIPTHKILSLKFKKIWVICSDWSRNGQLDENSTAVKQWLDSNLKLISSRELDGLWIYCYKRRSTY